MGRLLTLDDLQAHFDVARKRLSRERAEILSAAPLPDDFCRDTYGFSYMRAERLGLDAITARLNEISWLPMHLDPSTEFVLENKGAMKKWLHSTAPGQPDSMLFGNDFVHALTRVALKHGWESQELCSTAFRIGSLFHDLSCLIGLIYYGVWMAENGIVGVPVTDPYNLGRTAKEISDVTHSPEIARFLADRERAQDQEKNNKKRPPPSLRVIKNANWDEGPHPPLS